MTTTSEDTTSEDTTSEDTTSEEEPQPPEGAAPRRAPKPTRLSVNISTATAEALREVSRDKGVSMTEAVRRLVGYGIVVYRAVRDGGEVLIRRDDKAERLILLD